MLDISLLLFDAFFEFNIQIHHRVLLHEIPYLVDHSPILSLPKISLFWNSYVRASDALTNSHQHRSCCRNTRPPLACRIQVNFKQVWFPYSSQSKLLIFYIQDCYKYWFNDDQHLIRTHQDLMAWYPQDFH